VTHPAVRDLLEALARDPALQTLLHRLEHEAPTNIPLSGLTLTAKALYLTHLWRLTSRPVLVITDGNKQAEALAETASAFFHLLACDERAPQLLPAFDVLPHQNLSPHDEIRAQRAVALWRMASGRSTLTIAPVAGALFKAARPEAYRQLGLTIRRDDELPMETLAQHLDSIGYEKREPVEMVGEYSIRGGIIDIFPPESAKPVRVEFFGDTVESIRRFEVESQRSIGAVDAVTLLPLVELPQSRKVVEQAAGWEFRRALADPRDLNVFQLLERPVIVWDEPEQTKAAAERFWKRLAEDEDLAEANYFQWGEFHAQAESRHQVDLRELYVGAAEDSLEVQSRPTTAFRGNMQNAVNEARHFTGEGGRNIFFALAGGEAERLADVFQQFELPYQLGRTNDAGGVLAERAYQGTVASTFLVRGSVRRGVVFPAAKLALYGHDDLFETGDMAPRPAVRADMGAFATDMADLKPGDYIVHITHGIGRFVGVKTIQQGDLPGDFMLLEYAGEAKLYVPLTRLDLIQKFRGSGDATPQLDRMGGATWAKTKSRVKAKMRDMADELLKLYAQRRMAKGFAFSSDSNWQREFEDSFEYSATKDQLGATRDIKRDMEATTPMDRLLCGDVGFGKTEVAMRAAFKALGDGKQVAVLAPTTVLAFQHYESFKRRFAAFPARIEHLSRFRTPKEIKAVLEDITAGKVDVAIGTHRLFSKDVEFADLGLVIIDEEQRFGVKHKEALKQLRQSVDVLTMSATPIPRTLHMSLLGIRDMSVIETPPKDRLAIHTVVSHLDLKLIKQAIDQEVTRGGQVYFIHNRVDSIYMRAASIQEMMPEIRVGVGHGQMGDAELEKALLGFMRHEFDVFVCTTIAENGLDIPLANTIIIENAERYGLSELYQLRGRVGRSNRRAYAYLMVPPDTELTEIARKRLAALKEFSDLGAGFKIAALDLELRGAGSLLGGEQHGHIASVGFDMYLRMLDETVRDLKGEEVPLEIHSTLNLGLDLRIPKEFVADENQRLRAYKKIADTRDREAADKLLAELADRYGALPEGVRHLVEFAQLKNLAQQTGIESIERRAGAYNIKLHENARVEPQKLMELVQRTPGAQFTPAGVLRIPAAVQSPPEIIEFLQKLIASLR